MASSYALPSTGQDDPSIALPNGRHDSFTPQPEPAPNGRHNLPQAETSSFDRKEALHGTGVALRHEHRSHQWAGPAVEASQERSTRIGCTVLLILPFIVASVLRHGTCASYLSRASREAEGGTTSKAVPSSSLVEQSFLEVATFNLVEAMILVSAIMLLAALILKLFTDLPSRMQQFLDTPHQAEKANDSTQAQSSSQLLDRARPVAITSLMLVLLLFAALQIKGWRVGLAVLSSQQLLFHTQSSGNGGSMQHLRPQWLIIFVALLASVDFTSIAFSSGFGTATVGYSALIFGALSPQGPPSISLRHDVHQIGTQQNWPAKQTLQSQAISQARSSMQRPSSLRLDPSVLLSVGLVLATITIILSAITGLAPSLSALSILVRILSISLFVLAMFRADSLPFQGVQSIDIHTGIALCLGGILLTTDYTPWPGLLLEAITVMAFATALTFHKSISRLLRRQDVDVGVVNSRQHHLLDDTQFSPFTHFLLQHCKPDSLIYSILIEKDSRRIAYFTCLNFAFMLVQGLYGYLSGSLGLLSDTVHMFFDCLGLIVGLGAAVASRWQPSPERPFGWSKLNTLAGFGNGIFLMLVSIEFAWEAIEGILERRELRRVKELLVVSTLGLLINLIGLFAFGHAHVGHDHSHGHSHAAHEHEHDHDHSHPPHGHSLGEHTAVGDHDVRHLHDLKSYVSGDIAHAHAHNENMHGIFLHVAADAGGSLAVIVSTALTLARPWYLWDPLATIVIAFLIFAAAVPLVKSSGRKLLLIMPDEKEHNVKSFLQEVSEARGILGYAAPRFWLGEEMDGVRDNPDADDSHESCSNHHHHHHHHRHGREQQAGLVGAVHVIAAPFADLEDVRERVQDLALSKGVQATIQVEYETDTHCWCGGSQRL